MLAPAFVDPHVHLRTPGREDEETIATGTTAAAAGGYCAILAMPNTEPSIDSAAVLGALVEPRAKKRRSRRVPRRDHEGPDGGELTEMAELAEAGAAGFSDDGRPVVAPGVMRRALQYHAVTGRRIAVHCEEPTLSRNGQMHEGTVSAEPRVRRLPVDRRERDGGRDLALAGVRAPGDPPPPSLRQGVGARRCAGLWPTASRQAAR